MTISNVTALVPSPGMIRPIIQNTRADLFDPQGRLQERESSATYKAKRIHNAYHPTNRLNEDRSETGGIIDIYA